MITEPVQLFTEAWKAMTGLMPSPIHEDNDGFYCCFSDTPNPFMNLWIQNAEATSQDSFEALLGRVLNRASHHAHAVGGIICDDWCPSEWEALASEQGLFAMVPMISMEAEDLVPPKRLAPDLDIRWVTDAQGARDLAILNARAYHMPEDVFECLATHQFWPDDRCAFVGYLDGVPVSCAAALPAMGTVYIALVATAENARGKGYAESVMRQAVVTGQEMMGVKRTTLHATLAGQPLYETMGYASSKMVTLIGQPD